MPLACVENVIIWQRNREKGEQEIAQTIREKREQV
jgi:hypothetical protein